MRVRDYQSGYDISELLSKIKTPKNDSITIGPPILGVNYRLKPSDIEDNESPLCRNARITRNYIEPRPGLSLIYNGFDSDVMYIREFILSTGEYFLIILTTKSLYYSLNLTTFYRLPWYYSTGTVTTAVASPTVTGSGTSWLSNARVGDKFKCDADSTWKTILTVDTNTQITLTENYGVARSNANYKIDRYFGGNTENQFWGLTIADADYFVFSQGIDPVLYVDYTMTEVKRLSPDCEAATFGALFADRLVIAGIPNKSYRLKWCARGIYIDWTGIGSGFKDWTEDPQGITGLSVFSGILIVYKSYSISHVSETGRADNPFSFKTRVPGIGLYYPGIFFSIGDSDVIGGSDNFYTYDINNVKSVGDNIKDKFLKLIDPNYANVAHSLVAEEFGEAQLFFPSANNPTPNLCWVYNYEMDIYSGEWDLAATASGYATQQVTESWNDAQGNWDSDTEIWDSALMLANTPLNLVSNGVNLYKQDPTVLNDNGKNFIFEWWSKEFISQSNRIEGVSVYRVIVSYYCNVASTLRCSLSGNGGKSFGEEVFVTLEHSEPYKLNYAFFDFINTFETLMVRFRCVDGGRFQITRVRVEPIPSGEIIP